uniref:BPTI/Kunitz inhibitor domain-containing protein n=1 Tax=Elaeophora elaphi TaxID=1147741 RepID=A0A0R3RPJ5_9BILA
MNSSPYHSAINACTKHIIISGARGTYLKHAIDKKIIQSSTEEISHDSAIMHINTPEHMGQKFIASKNENKVTLPATLNNSDAITDSVNDNSIIVTRERPDLSPIVLPKEWEMDPEGYRIIDKFDITSQNSLSLESFMSTITPTLTTTSSDGSAQSTTHNVAPSLVSVPITLNSASHAAPTLFSSTTSINQSVFSSVTTVPTILTNTTSASFKMIAEWEPTTVDSRREGSFEPSIPPSLQILSQPIPHDKSWLYDGLQSIMNSQALPEQHAQQEELSEKKLSFGSFQPIGTFALATFSTAVSNNNNLSLTTTVGSTSKIPSMLTDDPTIWSTSIQKSSNVMDTTVSSVKLQAKKPIEESRKSMKESEENYFNADSSIFMNTPNKALTILSLDRMRSSNVNTVTEQPELTVSSTEEAEKERAETTMDLSSMHDLDNTPVKTENNFSHQFANTIQGAPTEAPASIAPIPQPDIFPNQEHRVNTVEDHSLHHLKHQELQQSLMKNLNEIQFTAAHDIQTAFQNISSPTTVKQGELEELQHDQITANPHQKEEMESEILNQQNISDPQVTSEMTSRAVVHDVTSLQQLQAEEDDTCVLPPDAGTCHDYIPRWFYNSQTGKCEQFSYGSCGGNNNNFLDRQACERKCSQGDSIKSQLPERCTYKKDEGHSNGYNVKWYFNMRNLRCEQMVYQGQGGNANQFGTLGECQTFCTPVAGKVSEMDTTTQHIAHSLKPDFAASQDQENQNQQAISITGTDKMSENQHHAHKNSQNAAESHHHHGMIPNNDSVDDEEIQQISSKQYPTLSAQPPTPATNTQQISHSLETTTKKKVDSVKTFGATSVNKNNDAVVDLSNIFEDINHTPSCPNGLKPMQHADGRPVMCLPGRNQCSGNSLCYFNGVDFFCCPNAEDPYDEHVFGGYGGEEVKHGYKSVKKAPINGNELIVRKLRLRRQTQLFSGRPPTMNRATRIDSNGLKHSLSRASLAVNSSDAKEVENVCMQDVNTEAHLRFFYDRRVNTCRLFYYSGCGGNENNFATEDECRQRCKSDKVYIEDTPPGSCPLGEPPLGDNAPVICGTDTGSFECPKGYYCRVGPPNVCCLEKYLPVSEKIMVTKKNQKNIRFAPQSSRSPGYLPEVAQRGSDENLPLLIVPTNICPDGSDALLDESTQQPLKCGLGYDGQSFCPVGYYCSIDSENNGRLCCQLGMMGVKIPPPPRVPPYFGLRPSNPGEVLPRGSLPSDHISQKHHRSRISHVAEPGEEYSFRLALSGSKLATDVKRISDLRASEEEAIDSSGNSVPSDETAGSSGNFVPSDEATDSSGNVVPSDSKLQDEVYGRMMLKSKDPASRTKGKQCLIFLDLQTLYNEMDNNVPSPEAETNEVQIDIGEMGDPFESLEYAQKTISDRSICLLKPNEGRTCREDESPPRTNLQYFYSNRDKRCKLYFYRGCGGSQNRFETKRHCELTCAVRHVTLIIKQPINNI